MNINKKSIIAVDNSRYEGYESLIKPLYDSYNFANIPGTIEFLLSGETDLGVLPSDCYDIGNTDTFITLFIDALGWRFLEEVLFGSKEFSQIAKYANISKITSMFPSTTTAHVPTLNTGLGIPETKLFEWRQYNSISDDIIIPITREFGYPSEGGSEMDVASSALIPKSTLYERFASKGIESHMVMGKSYASSDFNSSLMSGAKMHSYSTLTHAFTIMQSLLHEEREDKLFINFYMSDVDGLAHKFGASSPYVTEEIKNVFRKINRYILPSVLKDKQTKMIIIADHGQDEFDPADTIYINKVAPEIEVLLRKNKEGITILPAGSSQDLFLYIEEGLEGRAISLLRDSIGDKCDIFLVKDFIKQHMFGKGDYDKEFITMLGDIVILPHDGESVWWWRNSDSGKTSRGQHGGLSTNQMEIPFIII